MDSYFLLLTALNTLFGWLIYRAGYASGQRDEAQRWAKEVNEVAQMLKVRQLDGRRSLEKRVESCD